MSSGAALQCSGYPEEKLQALTPILMCREAQAETLLTLMGEPDQYSYPSVFIYGHRATGKSHVLFTLLTELQVPHAAVSCVECVSAGLMFEQVLSALFGVDAASLLPRSPSLSDFVRVYRQACLQHPAQETRYIVVEKAELLRDMEVNLLPALLRLQELVDDNVTVFLLSEIVWEKFRPNTGCFEPLLLHFPDYTKAELLHILSRDTHPSYTPELYMSYINILLGVFYSVCRDLRELRHLAALNFSKFCEPLEKGEARESDTHKLWKNIEPHLKKAMQSVYLREVSSAQWEQQQTDEKEATALRGLSAHAHVELPYYSKFLLIAAYLASYNPARTDRRFFLKHHGKIKKTNFLKKHEKTSNHLLGPKPFALDRLLAIFYSVVDSRVAPTASVFSQVITSQLHTSLSLHSVYKCLCFFLCVCACVCVCLVSFHLDFLSGHAAAPHSGGTRRPARLPQVQVCCLARLHPRHLQNCQL